ncbi:MAG: ABC transporter ATP-binding protein, partial [Abditibacteriaceae bacterium]
PISVLVNLGAMFYLNWKLSFWIILILPPIAFLTQRAGKRIRRAVGEMQFQLGELTNLFQEKLSAMHLIQTFGTQRHEMELFDSQNEEAYHRSLKPVRIKASLGPAIDFVSYMGVLLVLFIGVYSGAKPADLLVFLFAMHTAAMGLKDVANINNLIKSGDAAAARVFEMLDTETDIADAPDAIDLRKCDVTGRVTFDDVCFAYNTGPQVLHNISFEIAPGEVVALAGLSGSGKSTIAALVPRLYDPVSGIVRLDGHDLRDVTQESLRAHLGTVPQDTTLFHGSVRDNIAYGRQGATDEQVHEAAQRANAEVFIKELPQGYNTQVGERGCRLSGGQRQRIAIARALLRDPKVLILDEATSSLDAESERLVQDALSTLMEGRTTLIIAHRFATIWRANKIIVLENGHIAEAGTHAELLAKKGLYDKLYQMQAGIGTEDNVARENTTFGEPVVAGL